MSEAMRLADMIQSRYGNDINDEAAAELRRLASVEEQRDELLEALRDIAFNDPHSQSSAGVIARAAIAKAEQNT